MSRMAQAEARRFKTIMTKARPAEFRPTTSRTFSRGLTVYELPFGRGKRWFSSGPASWLLGDWQVNSIVQLRSGAPYNLVVTGDLANLRGTGSSASKQLPAPESYRRSIRSRAGLRQSRSALSKDNFQWRARCRCGAHSLDLVQSMRFWDTKQHRRVR